MKLFSKTALSPRSCVGLVFIFGLAACDGEMNGFNGMMSAQAHPPFVTQRDHHTTEANKIKNHDAKSYDDNEPDWNMVTRDQMDNAARGRDTMRERMPRENMSSERLSERTLTHTQDMKSHPKQLSHKKMEQGGVVSNSKPILISSGQIASLREDRGAWNSLKDRCDREMSVNPTPVEVYNPDSGYTATGHTRDQLSSNLEKQSIVAYRSGLCYQLTGDTRYAQHAQEIIDAWSQTLKQIEGQKGQTEINFYMPPMIIAASWVRGADGWDGNQFGDFLTQVISPKTRSDKRNNIGVWGIVLDSSIAAYHQDRTQLAWAARVLESQATAQINRDGVMPQEICRSDTNNFCGGPTKGIKGLGYTHFGMLAFTLAGEILSNEGFDVYGGGTGQALKAGFERAALWANNPQEFPYYQSNKGKLKSVYQVTYFYPMLKHFDNDNARQVVSSGRMTGNSYMLDLLFGHTLTPSQL